MKAALVTAPGQPPVYGDIAEPVPLDGEYRVTVTAAAISPLVKGRASGTHYSASGTFPMGVGIDGTGRLEDGRLVYFVLPRAPYGSMAERTAVPTAHCLPLPEGLDAVTAAALANPGMSSWAAYTERAGLRPGETVLINGATGSAGRLAIQIARHLGATTVIATGRDLEALESLKVLGADAVIPLVADAAAQEAAFKEHAAAGIDVVVDYLWGRSAEGLLTALAKAGPEGRPLRYVQVGAISGADITLPGAVLRSSAITLMGSGIGSVPAGRLLVVIRDLLQAAIPAGLRIAHTPVPLADFEQAWARDDSRRRTVFTL